MRNIILFFDKLEDRVRGYLSRRPILYAIITAFGIIILWTGIETLIIESRIPPIISIVLGIGILLLTGAFVSFFIGGQLILSGLRGEKKMEEKTQDELTQEEETLKKISSKLTRLEGEVEEIKEKL